MSAKNESFSIAIIPDTQILSRSHPEIFAQLSQWIISSAQELNLQMVLHLGDVVHNGAADEQQFLHAQAALQPILDAGIPLLITPGNHDYDNMLADDRALTMFNRYFGVHNYENKAWFGEVFEPGQVENCYATVTVNDQKLLFLSLEFGPRDEVLSWADTIMEQHADHDVIVITHTYMYVEGERTKDGNKHNPKVYPGANGANDGEDMWQKSLKRHPNLIAVFSGHHIPQNISYSVDAGDHGNPVFQSFQNWQSAESGGGGRIRIMTFNPAGDTISFRVVNPSMESAEPGDGHEVHIPYKAAGPVQKVKFPL
jgi:predicted phosphodiesterase